MGTESKKTKKEQKNRHNNYHPPVMKEQLITAQKQQKYKKYDMHPLSPYPNPNKNEPLP